MKQTLLILFLLGLSLSFVNGQAEKDQKIIALVIKAERYKHKADSVELELKTERSLSAREKKNLEDARDQWIALHNGTKDILVITTRERDSYEYIARVMLKKAGEIIGHGVRIDKNGNAIYVTVEDTLNGNVIEFRNDKVFQSKFKEFKSQINIYIENRNDQNIEGYIVLYDEQGYYTFFKATLIKKEELGKFTAYSMLEYFKFKQEKVKDKTDFQTAFIEKNKISSDSLKKMKKNKAAEIALIHNIIIEP